MSCSPSRDSLDPSTNPASPGNIYGRLCDGSLAPIHPMRRYQTIPHPDYVQRVEICSDTTTPQTPSQFWILCDPVTGERIVVVLTFDISGNPVFPALAYNLDGTAYVGSIDALVTCSTENFDITEGSPWCDGATTIIPHTIWDVTNNPPTVVSMVWTDLAGAVVVPSGTQTPGACTVNNPVIDSALIAVPQSGTAGYVFVANVRTLTVHNTTRDFVSYTPVFVGAVTGTTRIVAPFSADTIDFEKTFMTSVNVTDMAIYGNGGGIVVVNVIDDN